MIGVQHKMPGVVYPNQERLESYVSQGVLTETTLAKALMDSLPRFGDKVAIKSLEGELTYNELDDQTNRFAASLLRLGLNPLDRVMFQVSNSTEIIIAIIACWKADLIPVCTLAAHRKNEIGYLAQHSKAKAHFIEISDRFDFPDFAAEIAAEVESLEHTIVIRGEGPADHLSMAAMIEAEDPKSARAMVTELPRDPYQVTVFQLSGGTTSIPKIIPRFSNEYLYNMECVADRLDYREDDVVFMPLQLIHNGGLICNFPAFLRGATVAVSPDISPASLFAVHSNAKPTKFALSAGAAARMKAINITSLIDFSHAKLTISQNAAAQIEEVLNVPSVHLFGMTEGMIAFGHPDEPETVRHSTIGTPVSALDEVLIVEPGTQKEVPDGEVGEMICRGPYTVSGYYDAKERDLEAFTPDGFYRSGDLMSVRMTEGKKYFAFEGRLKDVISRGGEKINCEEVEHAARKHPGIGDILIVAMPDKEMDERACAFVTPSGAEDVPDTKSLMEFLVGLGLAKYKCPERVETIDEFPMTDSGKPSKPKLKEIIETKIMEERAAVTA